MSANYKLTIEIKPRFRDIDMLGHVNNAVYHTFMEEVRLVYYQEVFKKLTGFGPSFILAGTTMNYRSQAMLGETLRIGMGVREIRKTNLHIEFAINESTTERLVADGSAVWVCFDYGTMKKTEIPEDLAKIICNYEGPELIRRGNS